MIFSMKDTLVAKGIAIILLLIHHLFYSLDYKFCNFILYKSDFVDLATISKVCVAIFLILSGYGLSMSWIKNNYTCKEFYRHFYLKLYKGFLPISLLSLIPVIFHYKNISFTSIWVNSSGGIVFGCVKNILGIQYLWNEYGYNPTWWFMSLIVILYTIFPFLYKYTYKYSLIILTTSYFLFFIHTPIHCVNIIFMWLFPFVIGIVFAQKNLFYKLKKFNNLKTRIQILTIVIILALLRVYLVGYREPGTVLSLDAFFALSIIIAQFFIINSKSLIYKFLSFLGQHSMNIFLSHTFVLLYFNDFSYILKYPPLIFIQLLVICLLFSIILEKIKKTFNISYIK